ncbi:sodium/solute symporter [candidate division WOR-3 bacterium]|uniref:Sodium/proline symporter n=1 Tax=candidate division WOR-3 bacterium TaxID=2052148 RepID=A0A9D5KAE4_UNCW3|nr:sodium/solute symporter [candidate division WOR-3 bacterium]MBD3365207.1 sodium/solute symporter [candidate division WOR-3 bacterium]
MGRKSKKGSDYFLGGRKIGPWATAFSFVAAYFSSVLIIGGGGFGYKFGLSSIWIGAINVLVGCFMAWAILGRRVRRMTQRLGTITVPGFFAERFGSPAARLFSAGIILIFLIVYNVSVLKGMGNALEVLLGWPYWVAVLVSGAIILLYVAVGGYIAVVWTSFVQAWVMIFGLIFLTIFALLAIGGLSNLTASLSEVSMGLVDTPGEWGWAGLISISLILSFGVWGMPQLIIRFYSIKKAKLLRIGTVLATVGGTIALLPYLNGAIARALYPEADLIKLYPNVPANLIADRAIPHLVKEVLPSWAGGLLLAGVIAAGMSTFAAILIIVSSAVVRDVVQKSIKVEMSEKKVVVWGRIVSLGAGLISLLIALRPPDLILVITTFAWAVIASTNLWPILFGVYWKRASRAGVFASMVSGGTLALLWEILRKVGQDPSNLLWKFLELFKAAPENPFSIHGFVPGMIVALLVIVLVSVLTKKPEPARLKKAFG